MSVADILVGELRVDPLGLGYAAHLPGDPQRVVDLITAPTQSKLQPMTASRALVWGAKSGAYAKIIDTGNEQASPYRSSCLAFRDNILGGLPIDLSDPDVEAEFDAWEAGGIITAEAHALAIQYATQPASRADVLGIPAPSPRDILDVWEVQ
jgi:hypothetical protein